MNCLHLVFVVHATCGVGTAYIWSSWFMLHVEYELLTSGLRGSCYMWSGNCLHLVFVVRGVGTAYIWS
jgi:hypothetical protein